MFSFYERENFNRTVYIVNYRERKIEEISLKELVRAWAEETTSPRGVEPKFHVEGNKLFVWEIGGKKSLVQTFETNQEAEHALLLTFKFDLMDNPEAPYPNDTLGEAQEDLKDYIENSNDEESE